MKKRKTVTGTLGVILVALFGMLLPAAAQAQSSESKANSGGPSCKSYNVTALRSF